MKIPLVDLTAQYRRLKPELDAAIQRVLDRGQFILGPEVEALEREIAGYCGTRQAVAVASGTDALELSLRACGIGPGDEVITTAFSFFATAEAILTVGATPVFVDIDPATYTLDPAQIEAALGPKTKAILPVHLYGHPCRMEAIMRLATQHRLRVIEDCAQAIGAADRGRRVGSFGVAGCLSFFPSKNLGAYGDGGMVVTSDAKLEARIRLLRTHGSRAGYLHAVLGKNSRLDELQAAILRVKLPHVEAWNQARRRHAQTYRRLIEHAGLGDHVVLPQVQPDCAHVYHLYVVRCRQRDAVMEGLKRRGIGAQVYYPTLIPHQEALKTLPLRSRSFPVAAQIAAEVLALPMYPELSEEHIRTVVQSLSNILRSPGPSKT